MEYMYYMTKMCFVTNILTKGIDSLTKIGFVTNIS